MVVEDAPRLRLEDLRAHPAWPEICEAEAAIVQIRDREAVLKFRVELERDEGRKRLFFRCPACGTRRRHLFLNDEKGVGCRGCLQLLYHEQALGRCAWKSEVAIPALRAMRKAASNQRRES